MTVSKVIFSLAFLGSTFALAAFQFPPNLPVAPNSCEFIFRYSAPGYSNYYSLLLEASCDGSTPQTLNLPAYSGNTQVVSDLLNRLKGLNISVDHQSETISGNSGWMYTTVVFSPKGTQLLPVLPASGSAGSQVVPAHIYALGFLFLLVFA